MSSAEFAVIALRFLQYGGAALVFGSSCFFLYAPLPAGGPRWARPLVVWGAAAVLTGSVLGLAAQTAVMAGSWAAGLTPPALTFVVTGMEIGRAAAARAAVAALLLGVAAVTAPGRPFFRMSAAAGAIICFTMGWMGHAAGAEGAAGWAHRLADIAHVLAAALWIGALAPFLILLAGSMRATEDAQRALLGALRGFSGVGSALVAALVATGLINAWFLIGPDRIAAIWTTEYGGLLLAKLALFAAMVGLAAANRFRLVPRLDRALARREASGPALAALGRSLAFESGAGLAVLGLVAWLGTLPPPAGG